MLAMLSHVCLTRLWKHFYYQSILSGVLKMQSQVCTRLGYIFHKCDYFVDVDKAFSCFNSHWTYFPQNDYIGNSGMALSLLFNSWQYFHHKVSFGECWKHIRPKYFVEVLFHKMILLRMLAMHSSVSQTRGHIFHQTITLVVLAMHSHICPQGGHFFFFTKGISWERWQYILLLKYQVTAFSPQVILLERL